MLNHPNVVTVIDVGETETKSLFVVMELLQGKTLAQVLASKTPLPLDTALSIATQIVAGMGAGQGVGLVHRDLKPENIFILEGQHVKILDFGLALLLDPNFQGAPHSPDSLSNPNAQPQPDLDRVDNHTNIVEDGLPLVPQAVQEQLGRQGTTGTPDHGIDEPPATLELAKPVGMLPQVDFSPQASLTPRQGFLDANSSLVPFDGLSSNNGTISPVDEEQDQEALSRLTRPGTLMGTPRYMAPEQVLGWDVDHRSDIYSFGCIFFEMLTGRCPFNGPGPRDFLHQHLHQKAPSAQEFVPDIPRTVARLVGRLLAKSPSDRVQDWAALAETLRQLRGSVPTAIDLFDDPTGERLLPAQPFRFLNPFTAAYRSIFFGRDRDARRFREAWEGPDRPPVMLVIGASGVGKTSFVEARLIPGLKDTGHQVIRVRGTSRPLEQLHQIVSRSLARMSEPGSVSDEPLPELLDSMAANEGRPIAVVLDQVEEVLTTGNAADVASFQAGVASILAGGDQRVRLVFSLREDYLGALIRGLYPLPIDQMARTFPLRPLEPEDIKEALIGPGREGLPVRYTPFSFEEGLVDQIVDDLLEDHAGEITPRVQAVGARLWEMVEHESVPVITKQHYEDRLGGARGILSRILDEAIMGLPLDDRGVAKELLRALTHLPGSPTSRPAPRSELIGHASDVERRSMVLTQLENRWRVVQTFADPRWPNESAFRIAHESLIDRIQQYGDEGTERNRARQLFHHGLTLWLKGGRSDVDVLPEQHFDEVQQHIEDLVIRGEDAQLFYEACLQVHNEGWMRRHLEQRRRTIIRRLQLTLLPSAFIVLGFLLGQMLVGFSSLRVWKVKFYSAFNMPRANLAFTELQGSSLDFAYLHSADLTFSDLSDADLTGANLENANLNGAVVQGAQFVNANMRGAELKVERLWLTDFTNADLRHSSIEGWRDRTVFDGALFNSATNWGNAGKPRGALGPYGFAPGVDAQKRRLLKVNLTHLKAPRAVFVEADLSGSGLNDALLDQANFDKAILRGTLFGDASIVAGSFVQAQLEGADFRGADLRGADLTDANLMKADLRGTKLEDANLCGADLTFAKSTPASFVGVKACTTTKWPGKSTPENISLE